MPATLTAPTSKPTSSQKLMTADEFMEFCDRSENENRKLELVRGEVIEMPRPRRNHGITVSNFCRILGNYSFEKKFGYCSGNTGVIVENDLDTVRGPDATYWNDIQNANDLPEKWGTTVPLVAVEVLSPSNTNKQVAEKLRDYLARGVREVWIADYADRSVAIHCPDRPHVIYREADTLTSGVLVGFSSIVWKFFELPSGQLIPKSE